jgi:broad specificity phosphatase PhoE
MTAPLTLHFIRHGDVHNPDKILYGRMPGFRLSDIGRNQAAAAARQLASSALDAVYASPMERAQETAQVITTAQEADLSVQTEERIIEVYSPYDGTPHAELEKTYFDLYTGTADEYEKPADLEKRTLDFVREMRETHSGGEIAAVTHGDIVVAMFLWVHGYEGDDIGRGVLKEMGLPEHYPSTASISTLTFRTDDPDEIPAYQYTKPY